MATFRELADFQTHRRIVSHPTLPSLRRGSRDTESIPPSGAYPRSMHPSDHGARRMKQHPRPGICPPRWPPDHRKKSRFVRTSGGIRPPGTPGENSWPTFFSDRRRQRHWPGHGFAAQAAGHESSPPPAPQNTRPYCPDFVLGRTPGRAAAYSGSLFSSRRT